MIVQCRPDETDHPAGDVGHAVLGGRDELQLIARQRQVRRREVERHGGEEALGVRAEGGAKVLVVGLLVGGVLVHDEERAAGGE